MISHSRITTEEVLELVRPQVVVLRVKTQHVSTLTLQQCSLSAGVQTASLLLKR